MNLFPKWKETHRHREQTYGYRSGEGVSVQFCRSAVSNSVTPWTAAYQSSLSITSSRSLLAGSWHRRSHPWQGHDGEILKGKVHQVFRDSKKLPPALTLKTISVFLMLAPVDYSLISVTQAEGLPPSLSK